MNENLICVAEGDRGIAIIPPGDSNQFTLQIDATPGAPCTVETATDFGLSRSWTPLFTTNSLRMPLWFTDTKAATGQKFYRIVQP